ncbi:MAG TPA: tetratricopeptide repeat protein [Prolixibacteraceae bacterium]|nr:tetratricopeptide repeat protein [Prolixibacteraceae bacterium]
MKKTSILLVLVFAVFAAFAQKGKVSSAQNLKDSGELKEALETIEMTIDPANEKSGKTIDWPRTWEVRGEIYQAIFQSDDTSVKSLVDDPLTKALESYKKALELDEKDKFSKNIKIKLTLLINDLTNQAVQGFNNEDYEMALKSFEQILDVEDMDLIKQDSPDAVDTVIIFNTALAAYNSEQYDKAIDYYKEAAKYGYNGARTYNLLANSYQLKKDTIGALNVLKEGFEKYPADNGVLTSMIQIYLDLDKTEDALKYLNVAIEQDPQNATFYFAKGTLHEKMGVEEEAIEAYNKAIEADPKSFDAFYNLGALYYNKGVKQIEVANAVPANENEKYQEELKKADKWFKEALPFMEKCYNLNPEHTMTLESLKNLYYRLKMMDQYNEILEKIG